MTRRQEVAAAPLLAISSYGREGASTRVRLYDWIEHCGLEETVKSSYIGASNNQFSTLVSRAPEVVRAEIRLRALAREARDKRLIISKQASPFSSGIIEQKILQRAAHSTYDFDDALLYDTGGLARRLWSKADLWTRAVQAADVVIAGSEILADQALQFRGDVVMIPSCVEPGNYVRKSEYAIEGTPRGVWIGSPSTEQFLLPLSDPLLELNRKYGLRLTVISAGTASLGRLDAMTDRVAWSENSFANDLSHGDFGMMPLPDTLFTRGKCSYKLLQYAAAALPIVGSPVGANDRALSLLGGIKASSETDWLESVETLINMGENERAKQGLAAVTGVKAHYSFGAWKREWLEAVGLSSV